MLLTPLVGEKTIALSIWTFVGRVMSLLFSTVCHYFPAKKQSSSDFMAAVTIHSDFEAQEEEIRQCFYLFPSYFHAVMRADTMFLVFFFGCLVLSHLFHASSPSSRGSSVLLHFLPVEWCYLHIWGCWYFSHLSWFQLVTHPAWHFSWCAQHIA